MWHIPNLCRRYYLRISFSIHELIEGSINRINWKETDWHPSTYQRYNVLSLLVWAVMWLRQEMQLGTKMAFWGKSAERF